MESHYLKLAVMSVYYTRLYSKRGAHTATGIDLSDAMLNYARQRAADHHLSERVSYELGDFVEAQDSFKSVDIT